MRIRRAILFLLAVSVLSGQTDTALPRFEVASIKPSDSTDLKKSISFTPGGSVHCRNYSLMDLIKLGWSVRGFQVLGGPRWLDSDRYNLDAKPTVPLDFSARGGEDLRQFRLMVQFLLADRFKLTLHSQTKEMSVYFLVTGPNGSRLKRTGEAVGQGTTMHDGKGFLAATQTTVASLAANLGGELGVPVIDKTGLDGIFDFRLEWNPDEHSSEAGFDSRPSILTAVQEQLGLKLESGKGPVEILVVDRAEKASEN